MYLARLGYVLGIFLHEQGRVWRYGALLAAAGIASAALDGLRDIGWRAGGLERHADASGFAALRIVEHQKFISLRAALTRR